MGDNLFSTRGDSEDAKLNVPESAELRRGERAMPFLSTLFVGAMTIVLWRKVS